MRTRQRVDHTPAHMLSPVAGAPLGPRGLVPGILVQRFGDRLVSRSVKRQGKKSEAPAHTPQAGDHQNRETAGAGGELGRGGTLVRPGM